MRFQITEIITGEQQKEQGDRECDPDRKRRYNTGTFSIILCKEKNT